MEMQVCMWKARKGGGKTSERWRENEKGTYHDVKSKSAPSHVSLFVFLQGITLLEMRVAE